MSDAICCKPGSTNKECRNGRTMVCSEPAVLEEDHHDEEESFHDILTTRDQLNHQMFAFCTLTSQKVCGISSSTSTDMRINAGSEARTISSNTMRYTPEGAKSSHDSCYYEIGTDDEDEKMQSLIEEHGLNLELEISFSKVS